MRVRVWDLPTRLFHWGLATACLVALASGEESSLGRVHVAAGWAAAALLSFRVVWGLVGERWSRWVELGRAPGHERAASVSIVAALVAVGALGLTGLVVLGGEEFRGPLAGLLPVKAALAVHTVHAVLAWGLAAWVAVHLAGVARASWHQRQNLVRSMLDGRKRFEGPPVRLRGGAAAVLVALTVGTAGLAAVSARDEAGPTLERNLAWDEACGECHLAFHPSLLPAASWERMVGAEDHFGEFLALDPSTAGDLTEWARANAAERASSEHAARILAGSYAGDRITETRTWRAAHAELGGEVFERDAVGGRIRCGSCHPDAEQGTFDARAAHVPNPNAARLAGGVP